MQYIATTSIPVVIFLILGASTQALVPTYEIKAQKFLGSDFGQVSPAFIQEMKYLKSDINATKQAPTAAEIAAAKAAKAVQAALEAAKAAAEKAAKEAAAKAAAEKAAAEAAAIKAGYRKLYDNRRCSNYKISGEWTRVYESAESVKDCANKCIVAACKAGVTCNMFSFNGGTGPGNCLHNPVSSGCKVESGYAGYSVYEPIANQAKYELAASGKQCKSYGWLLSGAHPAQMSLDACAAAVRQGGYAQTNAGAPCASDTCGKTWFTYHAGNRWCGCATTKDTSGCNPNQENTVDNSGQNVYKNNMCGEKCLAGLPVVWVEQKGDQCGSTNAENVAASNAGVPMESPGRNDQSQLKDWNQGLIPLEDCKAKCVAHQYCRGIEVYVDNRCSLMYSGTSGGPAGGWTCHYFTIGGSVPAITAGSANQIVQAEYGLAASGKACKSYGWLLSGDHPVKMSLDACAAAVRQGGYAQTNAGAPCGSDPCARTWFTYHAGNQWCGCASTKDTSGCNPDGNAVDVSGSVIYENFIGETCEDVKSTEADKAAAASLASQASASKSAAEKAYNDISKLLPDAEQAKDSANSILHEVDGHKKDAEKYAGRAATSSQSASGMVPLGQAAVTKAEPAAGLCPSEVQHTKTEANAIVTNSQDAAKGSQAAEAQKALAGEAYDDAYAAYEDARAAWKEIERLKGVADAAAKEAGQHAAYAQSKANTIQGSTSRTKAEWANLLTNANNAAQRAAAQKAAAEAAFNTAGSEKEKSNAAVTTASQQVPKARIAAVGAETGAWNAEARSGNAESKKIAADAAAEVALICKAGKEALTAANEASGSHQAAETAVQAASSSLNAAEAAASQATADSKAAAAQKEKATISTTEAKSAADKAADEVPPAQSAALAAEAAAKVCPMQAGASKTAADAAATSKLDAAKAFAAATAEKATAEGAAGKAAEAKGSADAAKQQVSDQKALAIAAAKKAEEQADAAHSNQVKATGAATSSEAVGFKNAAESAAQEAASQKAAAEAAATKAGQQKAAAEAAAETAAEWKAAAETAAGKAGNEHATGFVAKKAAMEKRKAAEDFSTKALECKASFDADQKSLAAKVQAEEAADKSTEEAEKSEEAALEAKKHAAIASAAPEAVALEKATAESAAKEANIIRPEVESAAAEAAGETPIAEDSKKDTTSQDTAFQAYQASQPAQKAASNATADKATADSETQKVLEEEAEAEGALEKAQQIQTAAEYAAKKAGEEAAAADAAAKEAAKEASAAKAAAKNSGEQAAESRSHALLAEDMKYADEAAEAKKAADQAVVDSAAKQQEAEANAVKATASNKTAEEAVEQAEAFLRGVKAAVEDAQEQAMLASNATDKAAREAAASEAASKAAAEYVAKVLAAEKSKAAQQEAICHDQRRFDVIMCESHMCSKCALSWCSETCQKAQIYFPNCRCKNWVVNATTHEGWARTSFSTGDWMAGHGKFGDAGDYGR